MSLAPAVGLPRNCGTFGGATAPIRAFYKRHLASTRFRLRALPLTRVDIPETTTSVVVGDRNITRLVGSTLIVDYEVYVEYLVPDFGIEDIAIFSGDTSKLMSPVGNVAEAVGPGSVILKAFAPSGEFAAIYLSVMYVEGTTSDRFDSYVAGSVAKNASDAVDSRIANKEATSKPIYLTQDHMNSIYLRNPDCWAADIDLTCISPWNSTSGGTRAGTLISPRHVLFCEHLDFHPSVGSTIRFVTLDNTVVERTITALATHPDYSAFYPDITIGVLNSDVPPSISFAKVLPQNWTAYLPSMGSNVLGATIPALVLDQEENALVSDWRSSNLLNSFSSPMDLRRRSFFEFIISGDSGNPAFLIINDELVVLNTWTYGGAGSGTNLILHKASINLMMANLGGGYQLTEVDLSGFPTY